MDEAVVVILLLAGSGASSSGSVYHFVRQEMSWRDAADHCKSEHIALAQIDDEEDIVTMMSLPTGGYRNNAWIGLYENASRWTWMDGQIATYFQWNQGQPDNTNASEFCVNMNADGKWNDANCTEEKVAVCAAGEDERTSNEGGSYIISENKMTWEDAKTFCEVNGLIQPPILNRQTNENIRLEVDASDFWIGLSRPNMWLWSESGSGDRLKNWRAGQPDNLSGKESCASVVVEDGTWTDEPCETKLPFFCSGLRMLRKTVVRMKIQSRANMEDPAYSAELQRQLRAALANQGVTDVNLTLKKLRVREKQESSDKQRCSRIP